MLPVSSITVEASSGKVRSRPDRGWEDAADDSADTVALGPSGAAAVSEDDVPDLL
jgi:hypothetical protein